MKKDTSWCFIGLQLGELLEAEDALSEANILNNKEPKVWGYLSLVCLQVSRLFKSANQLSIMTVSGHSVTSQISIRIFTPISMCHLGNNALTEVWGVLCILLRHKQFREHEARHKDHLRSSDNHKRTCKHKQTVVVLPSLTSHWKPDERKQKRNWKNEHVVLSLAVKYTMLVVHCRQGFHFCGLRIDSPDILNVTY